MARLFISHSSRNNDKAIEVRDWLAANGWDDVFLDLDPERGIVAGQRWKEALQQAASRCEVVLALVSAEWLASSYCKAEINTAQMMGKKTIIGLIDNSQVPGDLTDEQFIDLSGDPQAYRRLKKGLELAGLDPLSFPFEPGRRPYPGFAYFEEQDVAVFFGRDAQIVRGLDEIRRLVRTGVSRMLVILGASGSGKSSFLRAGLWPRLKRDDRAWLPLPIIRPERAVISGTYGLAGALQQIISEARFAPRIRQRGLPRSRADIEDFIKTEDGLVKLFDALRDIGQVPGLSGENISPPTIVLALDQGEELFNEEGRDEAERFVEILTRTLKADQHTLAILAMRSDSFPLVQAHPSLAALPKDTFTLDMMLEGSYRAVIEDPARLIQPTPLRIDPQLTDALLEDISGQDALPLLAFTLAHLYENYAADNALTLAGYDKLGHVRGVIDTAVKQAFAAGVAKGELPKDTKAQLALARAAFIPHLAQVNAAGQFARRVATIDQIPAEARPLIDNFAEQRLLIKDRRKDPDGNDVDVVEVAHEALLRQPPFSEWLEEDREFLVWRERLSQARAAFEANERGLLAGRELAIARGYVQTRAEREIEAADQTFIRDSIAADDKRNAEEAEQERKRQAAEKEEQERRIRDAEQIAAEQRKAAAAGKRTARVFLVLSAIAVLVAVLAVSQYWEATKATKLATVREWAAQARTKAGTPQSLLLGLNSISLVEQIGASKPIESIQLLIDLLGSTGGLPLHHSHPVAAAAFSPNDRWLASASGGDVLLWNTQAPRDKPLTLPGSGNVKKIAFSPDGRWLAAVGDDAHVRVYEMGAAHPAASARALVGHSEPVQDAAFSPDGHWLATASADSTVRLWSITAPDPAAAGFVLQHKPETHVHTVTFSPDGHWLATGAQSGVRLWNLLEPSAEPKTVYENGDVDIVKVAFSPDANWLVAGATETYQALLFHTPFDGPPRSFHVNQWVWNLTFSPDKRWLVVPDHYNALVLDLNKADPTSEPIILRGHKDAIADMAFSPDGMWFATGSADHSVQLWNVPDHFSGPNVLRGHEGPISSVAFSGDSRWLASASNDLTARLWNVSSPFGQPISLRSSSQPTKLRVWDLRAEPLAVSQISGDELELGAGRVFSPNGKWLATLSNPAKFVHLLNLTTSPPTEHLLPHPGFASPVFSPDGRWLATGGYDSAIKLWDLTSPDPTAGPKVLHGHRGAIRSLAFSADGRRLVSGAQELFARVWDLTAPNPSAKPQILDGGGGTSIVRTVAISPDGRYVLTGSWEPDFAARVWDLSLPDSASKPIKLTFEGRVFDSAFSADGRWAAAGSWDHTAQLLDLTKPGAKPFVLQGHTARTLSVAFSPDNQWLATGNEDRTARLWSLIADDPSADSVRLTEPYGLGVSFSPDGHLLALSQTEYRSNPFSPDGSSFASSDADAELYDVRLEDLIALSCRIAGRNLTADEVMSSRQSPFPLNAKICPE